jgi:hypothetical protein
VACDRRLYARALILANGVRVVVMMTTMMMVSLRERGRGKQDDDGEQQSSFHAPHDSNKG